MEVIYKVILITESTKAKPSEALTGGGLLLYNFINRLRLFLVEFNTVFLAVKIYRHMHTYVPKYVQAHVCSYTYVHMYNYGLVHTYLT